MSKIYADLVDPEELRMLIGEDWANEAKVVQAGIVEFGATPLQGSLTTNIRQTRFQGNAGQALLAGETITTSTSQQESVNAPVLWRYDGDEQPNALTDIEVKDIEMFNVSLSSDIANASRQYLDDDVIATIEGVTASLTSHQFKQVTPIAITLDEILNTKELTGDHNDSVDNGAIVVSSANYWSLVKQGAVAATANTFGAELQNEMVSRGQLPNTIAGMTPIVTDKFASSVFTYLCGLNSVFVGGNDIPTISVEKKPNAFSTITNFYTRYAMGVRAMNWTISGKENVTTTELLTNTSWTIATGVQTDTVVKLYRLESA